MKFRDYSNYEVYEDGQIYSYKSKKFLKPETNNKGYKQVLLYDNEGKRKLYLVHRVVWESVTGSPIPNHLEVNHRSEDKTDNSFSNLQLVSHKENCNYGTRNTKISNNTNRSKSISKALTNNPKISKAVGAFKDGKIVMAFPSLMEAQRNGFHQGNVSMCCRNCFNKPGNNKYKGFEWKYI